MWKKSVKVKLKNKKGEKNKLFQLQIRRREQEVRKIKYYKEWEKELSGTKIKKGKKVRKENSLKHTWFYEVAHGFTYIIKL